MPRYDLYFYSPEGDPVELFLPVEFITILSSLILALYIPSTMPALDMIELPPPTTLEGALLAFYTD
jgi:hypothetical protein